MGDFVQFNVLYQGGYIFNSRSADACYSCPRYFGLPSQDSDRFWTNVTGREGYFNQLLLLLFPVFYISVADSFADLLIGGFLLGLSGAIFSAGVTSLPKYYPKERHGFVNGIYGMGNIGTAITTFSAPFIAGKIGWQATVQLFLILIFAVLLAAFLFGDKNEAKVTVSLKNRF